jgi:hypothetical protein
MPPIRPSASASKHFLSRALLSISAAVPLASASAQEVAWAWVFPSGAGATFTPAANYQYTPSGALITVDRDPVLQNRFIVRMPGLAPSSGVVHACAYGGNHTAVINGWGAVGTTVSATVELFTPTGGPANNAPFTVHYRREGANDRREAYLWADSPSAASYTPSTFYSWNGNRADPTITRSGVGTYQVTLPGLGGITGSEFGHVQVSSYGSTMLRSKVVSWFSSGADVSVSVRCTNAAGVPTDGLWVLSYNETAAPIHAGAGSGAHVWANSSTAANYVPSPAYTDSNGQLGPADAENITRLGVGSYRVELPDLAPSGSSMTQVTAYGGAANYASINYWTSNDCGGTYVFVNTWSPTGAPADSQFTLLYLTDRPAAVQDVAWAWVFPPGAGATFTPSANYQYTPSGALITVDRDPAQQNRFFVNMPGLAPSSGVVQAAAYGGNHTAVVNSWGNTGTTVTATVELFTPTGAPANDAAFTIHYRREGPNDAREAYLWANDPSSASYTPSTFYSWNGDRPDPTITRTATGVYQVTLPGLASAGPEFGHVQVTPYATSLLRAKVSSWGTSSDAVAVTVRCFDGAGTPTDGRFVLSYNERAAPIGARYGSGAHVWANDATTASYTPSAPYTDSNGTFGPAGTETITRLGTGSYRVQLPNVVALDSSIAQVSAYGSTSHHASIDSWFTNGAGGTVVYVRTWTAAGAPVDSLFTLLYLTDRSAVADPSASHRFFGAGCGGLAMTATPDPVSTPTTGTTLTYRITGAPPFLGGSSPAVGIVALTLNGNPSGVSLAALGAPGCLAYVNALDFTLVFSGAVGTPQTVSFTIPPGVPCGTQLFAQAAALTTLNAFGAFTSNGLDSRIEDF